MRKESNLLKYVLDSFVPRKSSQNKVHFSKTVHFSIFKDEFDLLAAKILTPLLSCTQSVLRYKNIFCLKTRMLLLFYLRQLRIKLSSY